MFQLTEKEVENMVSQNAIPSKQHLGGSLPYAFTEHGVLMLANVLESEHENGLCRSGEVDQREAIALPFFVYRTRRKSPDLVKCQGNV
jgi:hypothetical protein